MNQEPQTNSSGRKRPLDHYDCDFPMVEDKPMNSDDLDVFGGGYGMLKSPSSKKEPTSDSKPYYYLEDFGNPFNDNFKNESSLRTTLDANFDTSAMAAPEFAQADSDRAAVSSFGFSLQRRDESPHVIRDSGMKADGLMTHVQDMPATFYKGYDLSLIHI